MNVEDILNVYFIGMTATLMYLFFLSAFRITQKDSNLNKIMRDMEKEGIPAGGCAITLTIAIITFSTIWFYAMPRRLYKLYMKKESI